MQEAPRAELKGQLFNERLTISRLELGQLKSAGEENNAQGAHLQRIVEFKTAREELNFVFVFIEDRDRGE